MKMLLLSRINRSAIIFILLSVVITPAQKKMSDVGSHFYAYLWSGAQNTFSDPLNQWIIGGFMLGALAANSVDNQFQDYAQDKGLLPKKVSKFGDLYGGTWAHWILFSAIIGRGVSTDESREVMLRKIEYSLMVLAVNGTITYGLKYAIGLERPNPRGLRSFPSGHTSHSFAIAAVYNELFGPRVGILAYGIAGIVAASRIHDNKHFLSDVIFGAGLGTIMGRGFAHPYRNKISLFTIYPNGRGGLTLVYSF